jgi:membrane associated rhomboid family serine protease
MGAEIKRKPPVITIALIVINCLIYFTFQTNDNENYFKALGYYSESGLETIELNAYMDILRDGQPASSRLPDAQDMLPRQHAIFLGKMMQDSDFQGKLEREEIIAPDHDKYAAWKDMRRTYTEMLSKAVVWSFGFTPAFPRLDTTFTHMFLHGGFDHLFGNMLVLWLVGCIVELGSGRRWFLGIYLPGGLAAVGLFWLFNRYSTIPLVGASGAISAVMGACAVLYGTKKIKIFYSLGFYFGYRSIYALALLPVWIGNELYQLFFGGMSNVAYLAHIGGFIGGALAGAVCLKVHGVVAAEKLFHQDVPDRVSPLIEQAMECMGKLQIADACSLFEKVLQSDPANATSLQQLFSIYGRDPNSPDFHRIADLLLGTLCTDRSGHEQACRLYEQYSAAAKTQRLSPSLYVRLSTLHAEIGRIDVSERIIAALLESMPDTEGLPAALLKLADAYRKKNLPSKAASCLQRIVSAYPASQAGRIAMTALSAQSEQPTP